MRVIYAVSKGIGRTSALSVKDLADVLPKAERAGYMLLEKVGEKTKEKENALTVVKRDTGRTSVPNGK